MVVVSPIQSELKYIYICIYIYIGRLSGLVLKGKKGEPRFGLSSLA